MHRRRGCVPRAGHPLPADAARRDRARGAGSLRAAAVLPIDLLPWGLLLFVAGLYLAGVLLLLAAGRRTDARALAGFVPDCAVLIKRLAAAATTTRSQRLVLLALLAYLLTPIDIVPDFIPVAGQLDDAVLVTLALGWLLRTHGEHAIRQAWPGPEGSLRVVLHAAGASRARQAA